MASSQKVKNNAEETNRKVKLEQENANKTSSSISSSNNQPTNKGKKSDLFLTSFYQNILSISLKIFKRRESKSI